MVLVTAEFRRRGLASNLLRNAASMICGAPACVPVLDATPAGREVYRGLGFADTWSFARFARGASSATRDLAPGERWHRRVADHGRCLVRNLRLRRGGVRRRAQPFAGAAARADAARRTGCAARRTGSSASCSAATAASRATRAAGCRRRRSGSRPAHARSPPSTARSSSISPTARPTIRALARGARLHVHAPAHPHGHRRESDRLRRRRAHLFGGRLAAEVRLDPLQ